MSAGQVRVYRNEQYGTWSVADGGGWYPGIYADEAAARFVPHVDIGTIERNTHWRVRGQGDEYRPVTLDELRQWCAEEVTG